MHVIPTLRLKKNTQHVLKTQFLLLQLVVISCVVDRQESRQYRVTEDTESLACPKGMHNNNNNNICLTAIFQRNPGKPVPECHHSGFH